MNNENTLHGAKLWEKSVHVTEEIDRFTVGHDRELDLYLAKYDVLGSMATVTRIFVAHSPSGSNWIHT